MMFSGAFAVTVSARRRGARATLGFAVLTLVLLYALVANVVEKPDGIVISGLFILGSSRSRSSRGSPAPSSCA